MALYSVNVNLPGAKKVLTSESVAVAGSSTIIPMFVVALDASYMQATIDGYVECDANTDTSTILITHTAALSANQLVGNYAYVTFPVPEVRLIASNSAADALAQCTITVTRPFGTAPAAGHTVNIRRWEDFKLPMLFSSVQSFAETFIDKTAAGAYDWQDSDGAYYTLNEFKANGGSLFYGLPVISDSNADVMVDHLAPTSDTGFLARMLQLSPQPDLICCPKQPSLEATLSASNWASVDAAWNTYVKSRATDDTVDDDLRELIYVSDTPQVVATAATYRSSDLNITDERTSLVYGQYMVSSLTAGQRKAVSCAPAFCGIVNRVSTGAAESFGHAFDGANFTQVANLGLVDKDITPANRITLISNGINPLVSKPGRGTWFESQFTQKKTTSTSGENPWEHLHVIIGRAKIWNGLQPILTSVISEPNTSTVRTGLRARISSFMDQFKGQLIIADYILDDVSSSADVSSGTARFELKVFFNREIDFVELKLVAALATA